jgi:hypothetical protein
MKNATTGAVSGCVVWIIAFCVISMCILPVSTAIGGMTSVSNFAIQKTGTFVCPEDTTPDVRTYATTTTDENGHRQPSTAYVLQCLDASGDVVKEDPVAYAFIWIGILTGIGLVVAGLLAFLLAAPAGALIARLFKQNKDNHQPANIEPR